MCVCVCLWQVDDTHTLYTHTHSYTQQQQKAACVIYLTRGNSILSLCLWVIRVLARPPFLGPQNNIWPHLAIRIISMRHCPWTNTDNALISDARSCVSASYLANCQTRILHASRGMWHANNFLHTDGCTLTASFVPREARWQSDTNTHINKHTQIQIYSTQFAQREE